MLRNLLSKPACHLILVIILGFLGYSNTLNAPFMFDDESNIVKNPIIKNLNYYLTTAEAKVHNRAEEYPMLINRYIGSLTFALNYKFHGLDVTGYHVVNILIHLINSLLIYWLVHLIFITLASGVGGDNTIFQKHAATIALFSSLLFVTHPIQTQAVTYIVQRFASLATMFYLLSIIMYIKFRITINDRYTNNNSRKINSKIIVYYLISLFAAVLAMKTKEIAFTLPAMLVLSEFLLIKGGAKRRTLYLVPFILTMLIIPATLIGIAGLGMNESVSTAATRLGTDMPRLDYLFTEFRVIMTYISLLLFPVGQNLDYDYHLYDTIFDTEVFLSFMAILTIFLTVVYSFWRYRKTQPLTIIIFFGITWFFATLSVESSIIPIIDVICEHRMYLPSFGIFLAISTLLVMIIERCRQKWTERAVILSVIIAVLAFTGTTYSRNNMWNNKIVMWQDVVNKSPEKTRGYGQLATAYEEKGKILSLSKVYSSSTDINLSDAMDYYILGDKYYQKGLIDESIISYKNAINIAPSFASPYMKLSKAYLKKALSAQLKIERTNAAILEKRKYQEY